MRAGATYALRSGGLSATTRVLHWSVALGILLMLACGFWIQWLPDGPGRGVAIRAHKSTGLLVLALVPARVLWRWREGLPGPAGRHAPWERRAARMMHGALIAATLLMPLSGIARSLAYPRALALFGLPLIPQCFETRQQTLYAASAALHVRGDRRQPHPDAPDGRERDRGARHRGPQHGRQRVPRARRFRRRRRGSGRPREDCDAKSRTTPGPDPPRRPHARARGRHRVSLRPDRRGRGPAPLRP
ncbi:cytochrome b [Methylobacterium planeticum]|uniref:Cytochrome b n=1 Tax=Methylobacterium planeticum TaxID=2615211 RepID=A0A6N6MIV5_9HYPH|nr:cytochrome b [Methylobacterium planeticum]